MNKTDRIIKINDAINVINSEQVSEGFYDWAGEKIASFYGADSSELSRKKSPEEVKAEIDRQRSMSVEQRRAEGDKELNRLSNVEKNIANTETGVNVARNAALIGMQVAAPGLGTALATGTRLATAGAMGLAGETESAKGEVYDTALGAALGGAAAIALKSGKVMSLANKIPGLSKITGKIASKTTDSADDVSNILKTVSKSENPVKTAAELGVKPVDDLIYSTATKQPLPATGQMAARNPEALEFLKGFNNGEFAGKFRNVDLMPTTFGRKVHSPYHGTKYTFSRGKPVSGQVARVGDPVEISPGFSSLASRTTRPTTTPARKFSQWRAEVKEPKSGPYELDIPLPMKGGQPAIKSSVGDNVAPELATPANRVWFSRNARGIAQRGARNRGALDAARKAYGIKAIEPTLQTASYDPAKDYSHLNTVLNESISDYIDTAQDYADWASIGLSFIPGGNLIATGLQAASAITDLVQGQRTSAALRGGMAALGVIPGLGGAAGLAAKIGARAARAAYKAASPGIAKTVAGTVAKYAGKYGRTLGAPRLKRFATGAGRFAAGAGRFALGGLASNASQGGPPTENEGIGGGGGHQATSSLYAPERRPPREQTFIRDPYAFL